MALTGMPPESYHAIMTLKKEAAIARRKAEKSHHTDRKKWSREKEPHPEPTNAAMDYYASALKTTKVSTSPHPNKLRREAQKEEKKEYLRLKAEHALLKREAKQNARERKAERKAAKKKRAQMSIGDEHIITEDADVEDEEPAAMKVILEKLAGQLPNAAMNYDKNRKNVDFPLLSTEDQAIKFFDECSTLLEQLGIPDCSTLPGSMLTFVIQMSRAKDKLDHTCAIHALIASTKIVKSGLITALTSVVGALIIEFFTPSTKEAIITESFSESLCHLREL